MIVTTTPSVEGRKIVEYRGIVFGEVIAGVNVIKDMRPTPVLAMTATATPSMQEKISGSLGLYNPQRICVPFSFSNICLAAVKTRTFDEKLALVATYAKDQTNRPMIIFCQTKEQSRKVVQELMRLGINALSYHAGKDVASRKTTLRTLG